MALSNHAEELLRVGIQIDGANRRHRGRLPGGSKARARTSQRKLQRRTANRLVINVPSVPGVGGPRLALSFLPMVGEKAPPLFSVHFERLRNILKLPTVFRLSYDWLITDATDKSMLLTEAACVGSVSGTVALCLLCCDASLPFWEGLQLPASHAFPSTRATVHVRRLGGELF